jgi:hypothetical protein
MGPATPSTPVGCDTKRCLDNEGLEAKLHCCCEWSSRLRWNSNEDFKARPPRGVIEIRAGGHPFLRGPD